MSILLHCLFVTGLVKLTLAFYKLQEILLFSTTTLEGIAAAICNDLTAFLPFLGAGVIGVALTLVLKFRFDFHSKWVSFLNFLIAVIWLYFVLIGGTMSFQLHQVSGHDSIVESLASCLNCADR